MTFRKFKKFKYDLKAQKIPTKYVLKNHIIFTEPQAQSVIGNICLSFWLSVYLCETHICSSSGGWDMAIWKKYGRKVFMNLLGCSASNRE